MFRHFFICGIASLLLCCVFAASVPDSEDLSVVDRQDSRPCGRCPRVCYRQRRNAARDCMRPCRGGANCQVGRCDRSDGSRGFRCRGPRRMRPAPAPPAPVRPPPVPVPQPAPVPAPVPAPAPIIVAPPVVVAPTATPTATATASVTPSPSATPSVSPSVTPTSSVSATPSVTPSMSPSCTVTVNGAIGVTATNGVCTCGTSTATVTVLAPVKNNGTPLNVGTDMDELEARNCYNGCVNDIFSLACDPGSMATFASDGAAIVSSCCNRCIDTVNAADRGLGPNLATNQCRLSG